MRDNATNTMSVTTIEEINYLYVKEYIPATIIVSIVICIGVIGNLFTFIFYHFKTKTSTFQCLISVIALNDILVNIVMIHDVVELNVFVNYRSDASCKLFYVLKHWLVGNSLLLIVTMAIDRHRLVCHPFSKQITPRIVWFIVTGVLLFSFSVGVHYFATARITILNLRSQSGNSTVKGYYCSLTTEPSLSVVHEAFHFVDIVIHAISIAILIVCYSLVIRKVVHMRNKLSSHKKYTHKTEETPNSTVSTTQSVSSNNEEENTTELSIVPEIEDDKSTKKSKHENPRQDHDVTRKTRPENKRKRLSSIFHIDKTELKLTVMAFVITVTSVACFVPYYITMMLTEPNMDGKSFLFSVGEILARRSFILNCTVNPLVMLYYNSSFRQYTVNALLFVCRKSRTIVIFKNM